MYKSQLSVCNGFGQFIFPCFPCFFPCRERTREIFYSPETALSLSLIHIYYIGVPVNDDIMLSYQDTSYHDNATLRELSGRLPAPEFHQWMMKRGLIDEKGVLTELAGDASIFLQ